MRSEHQEQALVMYHLAEDHPAIYEHLFAIPNGDLRHPRVAVRLKNEGVKAGVPDLFLAVARGGYHGLFIEMKKPGGRVSQKQREWHDRLRAAGYRVLVRYGHQEAIHALVVYFGDEDDETPDP